MTNRHDLDDIELVLVDGDNLLHHVRGSRDEGGVAWLLPRMARWRRDGVRIIVALDGHPAAGDTSRRPIAPGVEFRHSGSRSADDLLISLLEARPYSERARTVVVTRDRALQDRARSAGGLARPSDWLLRALAAPPGAASDGGHASRTVSIGQGRRPRRDATDEGERQADRERWSPGRGATRKRGNPKRAAKRSRRR